MIIWKEYFVLEYNKCLSPKQVRRILKKSYENKKSACNSESRHGECLQHWAWIVPTMPLQCAKSHVYQFMFPCSQIKMRTPCVLITDKIYLASLFHICICSFFRLVNMERSSCFLQGDKSEPTCQKFNG